VADIVVPEARQRDGAKADQALMDSIDRDGLINPILVHQQDAVYTLVAGERRLDAHRQLKADLIRATVLERLDPTLAFRLEFQENMARKQLSWQQEAKAVLQYHNMRLEAVGPMWTQRGTATDLGMSDASISRYIVVAKQLDDEEVRGCQTMQGAFNLLSGRAERALAAASSRGLDIASAITSDLPPTIPVGATRAEKTALLAQNLSLTDTVTKVVDSTAEAIERITAGEEATAALTQAHTAERSLAADLIVNADFLEWASTYDGPKFDVLHLDFPYGKGYRGSNTRKTGRASINPVYLDDPDIYFELVDGFLVHQDNVAFPSAHLLFWFDMSYYQWTIDRITAGGWTLVQPFPLIWTKGYTGVASDPKRRPRHCYETALLFSRGDRRICKLENDHGDFPLDEKLHLNQKPLAMLRKFMSIVVDEHTAVLDPTCGSGSALAAALQLKAARVFGVELDASNADVARYLLQRQLTPGGQVNG
jgi:ParB/RepB/Spo0J family partition protein